MGNLDGIYEEYTNLIYKYLYRLTGDNDVTEELTQETFYQALRTIDSFNGKSSISTWLCQIAKHSWYKYLNKKSKNKNIYIDDLHDYIVNYDSPEKTILESENRVYLYKQVHTLREPYKEVVMLRVLGELSFSEIAKIMDKTENWARVTYHRAKIFLIERCQKDGNNM